MSEKIIFPIRINRYLTLKGLSARRSAADSLIEAGLVFINGKLANLGDRVQETDKVVVLKNNLHAKKLIYIAFYKPKGIAVIRDVIDLPGAFAADQLEKEFEGLIILTNDKRIAERMHNPRFVHEKEYDIEIVEKIPAARAEKNIGSGIIVNGQKISAKKVKILGTHKMNAVMVEGQTQQITKILSSLQLTIKTLKRKRVMNILLGDLKPGESRALEDTDRKAYLASFGLK
ncbi:MAG: S4 domain-containing protein [Patescibacteria group bacterium]